jgi:hypothetical protein
VTPEDTNEDDLPTEDDAIMPFALGNALCGLAPLGDDPYLRMQAMNVSTVDKWLMSLEAKVRTARLDEEKDHETEFFLSALSQMWLFSTYELLRTWRERASDILKWSRTGGFALKIAALEIEDGSPQLNREAFAEVVKRAAADPQYVSAIAEDLDRTHILFRRLEFVRIALAKHQVLGNEKHFAPSPGVARVDMWTGSMSYELSKGRLSLGELRRRDVGDELRALATDRSVPSKDELARFDAYLKLSPDSNPLQGSP